MGGQAHGKKQHTRYVALPGSESTATKRCELMFTVHHLAACC